MSLLLAIALAQQISLTPLARTYDPVPGYPGFQYNGFSSSPATDGNLVALTAFIVAPSDSLSVLFHFPVAGGAPLTVASNDVLMPGGGANDYFISLAQPSIHGGRSWFRGKNQSGLLQGIYSGDGGPLSVVLDNQTSGLNYFEPPLSSDGNFVHFTTGSSNAKRLWIAPAAGGPAVLVAQAGDPVPGAANEFMSEIYSGMLANGRLVYHARCQETAFFRTFYAVLSYDVATGVTTEIAGLGTLMPGYPAPFELVGWPATDGHRILFRGSHGYVGFGGWTGIYQWEAGVLSKVVDLATPRPDGSSFSSFGTAYGFSGDGIVLTGVKNLAYAADGLYYQRAGSLTKIVEFGDMVGGTRVDTFGVASAGIADGTVTFASSASFGGPQTLWRAELPAYGLELRRTAALRRGRTARYEATGALPGEQGALLLSTTGAGSGACPPRLGGLCLDLLPPARVVSAATADASGRLDFPVQVPAGAPLISVALQAAVARGPGGADSQKSGAFLDQVQP